LILIIERDTPQAPGTDTSYMYSGILFCGDCGHPMFRRQYDGKNERKVYYFCAKYEKGEGVEAAECLDDLRSGLKMGKLTIDLIP